MSYVVQTSSQCTLESKRITIDDPERAQPIETHRLRQEL